MSRVGLLLGLALVLAATPSGTVGQEETDSSGLRPYVGLTAGWIEERYEGTSAGGAVWTVLVGMDFNPRWGIRGRFGPSFELCAAKDFCHDHERAVSLSVVRHLGDGVYLLFGPIHAGLGGEIPLGAELMANLELDFAFTGTAVQAWPSAALAWGF